MHTKHCNCIPAGWPPRCCMGGPAHSHIARIEMPGFHVYTIACLENNFSYLLVDEATGQAALVDPCDPARVLDSLEHIQRSRLGRFPVPRVTAILTTHKHHDHAGGNEEVAEYLEDLDREAGGAHSPLVIYGGSADFVPGATAYVDEGDVIDLGALRLEVFNAPGHTVESIMFHIKGTSTSTIISTSTSTSTTSKLAPAHLSLLLTYCIFLL